jgi:hypothetical protein
MQQDVIRLRRELDDQCNDHINNDVAICPNQLPYNWNGTNYSALDLTHSLQPMQQDVIRCDTELERQSTTTSTTNVAVCPNQLPYNWNGTNYSAAGSYTFTTTMQQDVIRLRH